LQFDVLSTFCFCYHSVIYDCSCLLFLDKRGAIDKGGATDKRGAIKSQMIKKIY